MLLESIDAYVYAIYSIILFREVCRRVAELGPILDADMKRSFIESTRAMLEHDMHEWVSADMNNDRIISYNEFNLQASQHQVSECLCITCMDGYEQPSKDISYNEFTLQAFQHQLSES